jgi:hypothetical protein
MGTLLLFFVILCAGREVVWTHPLWIIVVPAAIIVAAFFFYPLAPAAVVLASAFVANMWLP